MAISLPDKLVPYNFVGSYQSDIFKNGKFSVSVHPKLKVLAKVSYVARYLPTCHVNQHVTGFSAQIVPSFSYSIFLKGHIGPYHFGTHQSVAIIFFKVVVFGNQKMNSKRKRGKNTVIEGEVNPTFSSRPKNYGFSSTPFIWFFIASCSFCS